MTGERHVVAVDGLTDDAARARADDILQGRAEFMDVELVGAEPLASPGVVRTLVDRLHDRRGTRTLVVSLRTSLASMTTETCDWLVARGVLLTIPYGGSREAHEANRPFTGAPAHDVVEAWIRGIHARYAARGVSPEAAYLNAELTVTEATVAAGTEAVVRACADVGLVYLQVRRPAGRSPRLDPDACVSFWRELVGRLLALNARGTLLVEKRLALHLEALGSREPHRSSPVVSCATCPYDPWCGSDMLRRYLHEDDAEKVHGSDWCRASMATFDGVLALLRPPEGTATRAVAGRWMRARDQVMARLRDGR